MLPLKIDGSLIRRIKQVDDTLVKDETELDDLSEYDGEEDGEVEGEEGSFYVGYSWETLFLYIDKIWLGDGGG